MKYSNLPTITVYWHNIKKGFYTIQLMGAILSLPALFYIGVTHDAKTAAESKPLSTEQNVLAAKTAANTFTVTL